MKKKNVAFCDTTNSIDNSDIIINALKLEDGCDDQTEKSLTEYFDADTTLLWSFFRTDLFFSKPVILYKPEDDK